MSDLQTFLDQCRESLETLSSIASIPDVNYDMSTHTFKGFSGDRQGLQYASTDIAKLIAVVECLREAVKSYASKDLWREHQPCPDLGYEAREALANADKIAAEGAE